MAIFTIGKKRQFIPLSGKSVDKPDIAMFILHLPEIGNHLLVPGSILIALLDLC
ncbi:MAG: hypothetical protein BWY45_02742 [Euryarchaeota archaeon ADurb.Bin294]|nr:MAG: hypothetical protein BWY45_02742 [Euryarchaeota archaeon ADurb.Bin294]